ncbi:hypothetical protein, partial [Porphyromonas gingivalis]|uniref:hypothetical protein n=1 Tax=Porphyromonas gingivalis TaxID=837 RepID=UPI0019807F20
MSHGITIIAISAEFGNRPYNNRIHFFVVSLITRQFDVRKRQWICFLISGKRPKNVGIMLEKVAN